MKVGMEKKRERTQEDWDRLLDARVRERNLKSGAITQAEVDAYIAGLPDVASKGEPSSVPQPALESPEAED